MRRKSIIGLCISFAFLGIIVLSIVYCFLNNNDIKTEYLRASYAIDVNDMDEMAGFSDYVFVRYVSSQATDSCTAVSLKSQCQRQIL